MSVSLFLPVITCLFAFAVFEALNALRDNGSSGACLTALGLAVIFTANAQAAPAAGNASHPTSINQPATTMSVNSESTTTAAQAGSTQQAANSKTEQATPQRETAVFGAGCFWCVESAFEMREGVLSVESGYMGGSVENPSYEQICTGQTGHAEVVKVEFNPQIISYPELVDWFFHLHDPTTLNRQGADVGTQYRSVIFTYGEAQREQALAGKARAGASHAEPIVTQIEPAGAFYRAEDYHQDFYRNNPNQPYSRAVIAPKMQKLQQKKANHSQQMKRSE